MTSRWQKDFIMKNHTSGNLIQSRGRRWKTASRQAVIICGLTLLELHLEAAPTATVLTLKPMPKPGWALATAILDGKVHVLGGENSTCGQRRDHFVYDPGVQIWSEAASMTQQRNLFEAVALGGRIYAISGNIACGAVETDQVEAYDPGHNSWAACAPLPKKLWSHAAAAFQGKIYVLGGTEQGDVLNRAVYVYDPTANAWSHGADFPVTADHPNAMPACSAASFGESIFTLVYDGDAETYSLFAYSPSNLTWTSHGVIPVPFSHTWETPRVLVVNQRLLIVHNAEVAGQVHLRFYSPATAQWEAVETSQLSYQEYNGVQAVSDGTGFYVLGGIGGGYTDRALYVTINGAEPSSTEYYWIITKGRDSVTAKALHGLSRDGANGAVLYQPTGLGANQYITAPAIRADGRIVFHVSTAGDCGPLYAGRLNVDGLQPLAQSYLNTPCGPIAWVPGRDEVLFSNSSSGVHRIDLDPATQDERRLTAGAYDEVMFATTQGTVYVSGPGSPALMFTMNLDGSGLQPWDPFNNGRADWAFLSSDEQFVAFRQRLAPAGNSLAVLRLDGSPVLPGVSTLIGGADVNLGSVGGGAWSPDGQTFCFQRDHDLWSINLDGTGSRQLTHGEYPFPQVWGSRQLETKPVTLALALYAGVTLETVPGRSYQIQYSVGIGPSTNWVTATNLVATSINLLWYDPQAVVTQPKRFYRAVQWP